MKSNLWKLVSVVVVLTIFASGLAMLLVGCGPEKAEATPTPVLVKPTATPVPSPVEGPVSAAPPANTPTPAAALPTGTPVPPTAGLIDDFEGGDFDARWWSFTDENTVSFTCAPDQPGHASAQAMRLTFEVGVGGYPGCGIDADPGLWGDAGGLSFFWQTDQPGLTMLVILSMEDPTQVHPDSKGLTPFQAVLQTPGEEWTPVTLKWDDFAKAEWVGESGASLLDPTRVVALLFQVNEAQSGSVWVDDLQLVTGPVARPVPTVPPTAPAALPQAGPVVDKWSLWTGGTQLRGANIWQHVVVPWVDGDEFLGDGHVGPPFVQEDLDRLAAMGANYVNISGPGLFTEKPPYVLDEAVQAHLDNLLDMIARADMFAVITARTGPGRSDFTFYWDESADWGDASLLNDDVWLKQDAQDAWVEMWRYTAERYRDNPVVVGYDLMCEPNGPGRLLEIWNGEDFYPAYAGTLYDWNQLYPRIVQAIREVDPDTPILVSAMGWGSVRWLPFLEPVDDPRTVYMVHQYEPQEQYTHQPYPASNSYPGSFDLNWDSAPDVFDRAWLDGYLSIIDDFKARYGAPVAVNEYGVMRWAPGAADFMYDSMDLFEQRGMNHAFWAWNPLWPPYSHIDDMNYLRGPDPDDHTDLATSDLIDVIREYWGRNTIRPSNAIEGTTSTTGEDHPDAVASPVAKAVEPYPESPADAIGSPPGLPAVNDFLYQLQNLDLVAIGDTAYDLVVMDYSADGSDETAFTADQIAALKHGPGGEKIVLAYMSIGEAENYRFYWQNSWTSGNPAWLDTENPDWPGNYKVHYWDPEWQAIIYGSPSSYLAKIIAAGFDGVYLDIIDAYSYYQDQGRDLAAQEMVDFVMGLANYARARRPGFLIFPQNAAELAADFTDYLAAVDGLGQEDVYYGYPDEGDPSPPNFLAEVEPHLDRFVAAGKTVLVIAYTTDPTQIDDDYARARARGYVPFVSVRALDQLTINPGHEPD